MFAERPLPANLDDRITSLVRAWRADRVIAALYLFGSRASGRPGPHSDVDLAVILADALDEKARWAKRLELLGEATHCLGTDAVDVVVLEQVPIALAHRILARGRLLCESDPRRRARVAAHVFRRYADESYLRAVLDAGLARRIREGRFAD